MMFLGDFFGYDESLTPTCVPTQSTEHLEIGNGIYDEIYMDSDINIPYDTAIPEWGYSTILNAKFKNNILAGNVDFALSSISNLVFKKRRKDQYHWTTIKDVPIQKESDLSTFFDDAIVASRTEYQYAVIPIVNGAEGTYQITDITVQFDGCFIMDTTNTYRLLLNFKRDSLSRNVPTNVIETVNSKYPFVQHYSSVIYDKFSISGTFIELDKANNLWDVHNGYRYRKTLRDFLSNRLAKIIKFDNGEIYLTNIVDQISESENGHPENMITTINAVEVGDVNSNADLYSYGFTTYLEVGG